MRHFPPPPPVSITTSVFLLKLIVPVADSTPLVAGNSPG